MRLSIWPLLGTGTLLTFLSAPGLAHDPIFGIGPHVLFKGGLETTFEVAQASAGNEDESELVLEITYGITGDWSAGIELPYASKDEDSQSSSGLADVELFTKYRFWRKDSLGVQESAAITLVINTENGDANDDPPLGNGATDAVVGITYGYEGLKWYRWVSLRYISPGENSAGLQLGNKYLVDFAGGWRPRPPVYKESDLVWLLEINGELAAKAELRGTSLANSGGDEWFVSPGIFWTSRNFAIKAGVQLPIASDLNGTQEESDYRLKASFEWHL